MIVATLIIIFAGFAILFFGGLIVFLIAGGSGDKYAVRPNPCPRDWHPPHGHNRTWANPVVPTPDGEG